jgi:phenylpyruvate tautomerase PptA (4-oxalocrotonate tautomerase family)
MATYVCTAAVGRLTLPQKKEIVRSITAIRHEETGAPRYLAKVVFYDVAPDSQYVAGGPAPANQIWVRGDIRGERTSEQKSQMLRRIMRDVVRASGAVEDTVSVYLSEIPAGNIAEYGCVLLRPGEEDAWLSSLPGALREWLRLLA